MLQNLVNILTSPSSAFASIRDKPTVLSPLLLLLGLAIFTQFWVVHTIDFDFFIEQTIRTTAMQQNVPESQIREGMAFMSPNVMAGIGAAGSVIIILLIFAAYATYFNLMARLSDDRYRFKHFLSLTCWCAMPALFTFLATILLTLLSSDGQITQAQMAPLSLNNLLFQSQGRFAPLLSSIDPMTLWSSALMIFGYRYLTGVSGTRASIIVLAPLVIIYAGWIAILLL